MILPNVTPRAKRSPLKVQRDVLLALMIRDLRARVEGRWLGLLWMLLEPLAHVLIILALFGFRQHASSPNVELPVFLVTGLLPFFMFRNLARRLPGTIPANRGLYAYRQVKPIDGLVSRAVIEVTLTSAVYLCALLVLGWLGYHWWPKDPLELMVVSIVLLVLGLGLGLVFAVLAHGRPRVQAMINLAFIPLYLLSGVIFPPSALPDAALHYLLWNPVLHLMDLGRSYFLPQHEVLDGVNLAYPAGFALVVLALGLSLSHLYRHQLAARD
jgi:capsular polysaccharide transport system permease protein